MNPGLVIAIVIGALAAYALIVQIIGHVAGQTARLEAQMLADIVDHPTRNARRTVQTDYAQLVAAELAQHGHHVDIIDVLDCLASVRVAFKDDIDGEAIDAYYAAVLGGDAS